MECDVCGRDGYAPCKACGKVHCVSHRQPENHDCPNTTSEMVGGTHETMQRHEPSSIRRAMRGLASVWKARLRYGAWTVVQLALFAGVLLMLWGMVDSLFAGIPTAPIPSVGNSELDTYLQSFPTQMLIGAIFGWAVWMTTG
jgi:hypothetical protein